MKNVLFTLTIILLSSFIGLKAQPLEVGKTAPHFSLQGVDGKTVSLSDYSSGEGVVVIFTCNTCPYAVSYEDRIIELHNRFSSQGFPVVAINPNDPGVSAGDSFEEMKKRAEEKAFPFPYLFDEQQTVFPAYGATRTPEVFVLKKEGENFVVTYTGTIDDNYRDVSSVEEPFVVNAVNALLTGGNPDPATTRAIGCTIKVKE